MGDTTDSYTTRHRVVRVDNQANVGGYILSPNKNMGGLYLELVCRDLLKKLDFERKNMISAAEIVLQGISELLEDFDFVSYYGNKIGNKEGSREEKQDYIKVISHRFPRACSSVFIGNGVDYFKNGRHMVGIRDTRFIVDYALILPHSKDENIVRSPVLLRYKKMQPLPINPIEVCVLVNELFMELNNYTIKSSSIVRPNEINKEYVIPYDNINVGNRTVNWWGKMEYAFNREDIRNTDRYGVAYILSKMDTRA